MDTKAATAGGIVLGLLVVMWQVGSFLLGWLGAFVPVAILLQCLVVGGLLWAKRNRHTFLQQLASAFLASLVASGIIFLGSAGLLRSGVVAALTGGLGTLGTGFVLGIVAAPFLRV